MDSVTQKARLEEEAISLYREYIEKHGYDPERAAAAAALEVAEGQQALEALEAGNAS
ncbi:hypothetical protein Mesil_1746 [Allomeiothermus silvanus DSM 9946]|uniref:Uncharacterized protein n=1 Tax=Allomeiothermus silvanus (strain ATCC 700542 / DSM 9946 / NBRC 106475 / NCIMB 13440 / VI-R2) TaxID=526227 RepID=D7BFS1_ALLS1|nr:hypothetical protein [Allomeiothermus silvanus]ADH63624.1 hypothetical protein Mesil_1746 [Allomeiothermus silvanus DSM 9946]